MATALNLSLKTVTSVSETLFPGISQTFGKDKRIYSSGIEIVSSLPLQMALYFDAFFFPIWLIGNILMFSLKYSHLSELYRIVLITIMIVITTIEAIRVYLGYLGNLTEKVPELAGFWLLTSLLQFPLQGFLLLNEETIILPMERALNIVMMLFILFEIISGYIAIKRLTHHQVTKFHLTHQVNEDNSSSHAHVD